MVILDPIGTKFQIANHRNHIRKFSNFSPEFSSQWSSQNFEYIFGSIGTLTTNIVVVDRTSHKVAARIPILVDISQVCQVSFGSFCNEQIYFVVWPTASDAFCLCSCLFKPWIYNRQNTWIRLIASIPCSYCKWALDHRYVKVLVEMLKPSVVQKCRSNLRYLSEPTMISCARVEDLTCDD